MYWRRFVLPVAVGCPRWKQRLIRSVLHARFVLSAPALMLGMALQVQAAPMVQVLNSNIIRAEVIAAQTGWCQALLKISAAYAAADFRKPRPPQKP